MGIKENPFGVGYSGGELVERKLRCSCCSLPFSVRVRSTEDDLPLHCDLCTAHYAVPNEDQSRRAARLSEHEPRLLKYAAAARAAADRMQEEVTDRRRETARALRARDRWRAVLVEVRTLHEEGESRRCTCGLPWPCETWQVLQEDRGIGREVNTRAYRDIIDDDYDRFVD